MNVIALSGQLRASLWRWMAVCVPLVLLLGFLSGQVSGNGGAWYAMLRKPAGTPPGWVFPVAWTVLYILQGVALATVMAARGARGREIALLLFALQLTLNLAWSPLFFGFHQLSVALGVLVAMFLLAVGTTIAFGRIRARAAWMMVPYLAWLVVAGLLNWQIDRLNPNADSLAPGRVRANIQG